MNLRLGDGPRRLRGALLVLAMVLSVFAGRLVQLQGWEAPAYADTAQRNRMTTATLYAPRGAVTDRNGAALASSVETVDVTVDQTLVHDPARAAAALSPLVGVPQAEVQRRLTGERRFAYVARQVSAPTWERIRGLRLPGILHEKSSRRAYPSHDLAANVVGFVGGEGHGLAGVEAAYDELLAGREGAATYEVAGGGRRIPLGAVTRSEPVRGRDVQLTIDRDIQWVAQQALARSVRDTRSESGSVVVLDPRSGDVLALAVVPTVDANDPDGAPKADRGNRALSEVYEPGSIGKIFTAAAAVEDGLVRPGTPVTVPPTLARFGESYKDSHPHGTLHLTFSGVLAQSSNIGTILATEAMTPQRLHEHLQRFGVGAASGMGLPESPGILPPIDTWSKATPYTARFGHGYSVNAVQMAGAVTAVARDGDRIAPRIVKGWTGADGRFVPAPPAAITPVVRPDTARTVREMLEAVVTEDGTAPQAAIPGYRVAGKTGTAERVDPRTGGYRGYTASFVGLAPADAPRLVVLVTLQNPRRGGYSGGRLAAPLFREVTSFALSSLRVPPTGAAPPVHQLEAPPPPPGPAGRAQQQPAP